jgi:hypothetical protein
MLDVIRAETTGPTLSTRNLAILHIAIYDAVNAIDRGHQPYLFLADPPPGSSPEAAATSAGREIMRVLYPSRNASTEALYDELITALPETLAASDGKASGLKIADYVVANCLLPVAALPCLRFAGLADGCPVLRVHGVIGREYGVQATTDFVTWSEVGTVTAAPGGVVCRDQSVPSSPHRFYRVAAR